MSRILLMGDVCPGGLLYYKGEISSPLKDFLGTYDYRVANLESAFGDGFEFCRYKMSTPTEGGNIIYSPDSCIKYLKEMHINAVSLANNHSCDNGLDGLYHTMDLLRDNGIAYFGAGRNKSQAASPHIVSIKGKLFCFLAYLNPNMRAQYTPTEIIGGINQLYEERVISDIKLYKNKCDVIIVMPHWGNENTIIPREKEWNQAKKYIEAGASIVAGSHSHTIQPAFYYKNGYVAFSMGNCLFPDRFINAPRITVYPDESLVNDNAIPVTYGFPFVNVLTLKKIQSTNRFGLLLSVDYSDKIKISKRYTYLSKNHVLFLYRNNMIVRNFELAFIRLCLSSSIMLKFLARVEHYLKSFQRKIGGSRE